MFATLRSISLLSPKTMLTTKVFKRKSSLAFMGDEATALLAQLHDNHLLRYDENTGTNNIIRKLQVWYNYNIMIPTSSTDSVIIYISPSCIIIYCCTTNYDE